MRYFLKLYTIAAIATFLCSCTEIDDPTKPPNVLLVIIDDLRPALGCYGDTLAITPNIDELAQSGLLFNHAYAQQAVCNPSRTSLMTGQRPDNIQVWDNRTHFRSLFPNAVTLPQLFGQNGYQTKAIGKIYHDPDWAQDSLSWTESEEHTVTNMEGKYANEENLSLKDHHADAWEVSVDPGESYVDIQVRNAALRYIRQDRDKPFFLAVGFRRPHLPFSAPEEFWNQYDRKDFFPVPNASIPENIPEIAFPEFEELRRYRRVPNEGAIDTSTIATLRHGYYASVSYIDQQVGLIVNALKDLGLDKNTVIILTSDHGYHIGEHQWWCKTTNLELDTRVPLIISAPSYSKGKQSEALVELIDLYPTIADLCSISVPETIDGESVVHLLNNPQRKHKNHALSQFPRPWFYEDYPEIMGYSIRTQDMRYTEWINIADREVLGAELYDHRIDEGESINRVRNPEYNEMVHRLKGKLDQQIKFSKTTNGQKSPRK